MTDAPDHECDGGVEFGPDDELVVRPCSVCQARAEAQAEADRDRRDAERGK